MGDVYFLGSSSVFNASLKHHEYFDRMRSFFYVAATTVILVEGSDSCGLYHLVVTVSEATISARLAAQYAGHKVFSVV